MEQDDLRHGMQAPRSAADPADREPDIVLTILASVKTRVHLTREQEKEIEREIRTEYGGQRVRIPKRGKHLTPEQRQEVYRQGLTSASEREILDGSGISRRTLYRLMKRGAR